MLRFEEHGGFRHAADFGDGGLHVCQPLGLLGHAAAVLTFIFHGVVAVGGFAIDGAHIPVDNQRHFRIVTLVHAVRINAAGRVFAQVAEIVCQAACKLIGLARVTLSQ